MLPLKAVPVVLANKIEAAVPVVPQFPWQVEVQLARLEVQILFPLVLQMNPPGLAMGLPELRVSNPPFCTRFISVASAGEEKVMSAHSKKKRNESFVRK